MNHWKRKMACFALVSAILLGCDSESESPMPAMTVTPGPAAVTTPTSVKTAEESDGTLSLERFQREWKDTLTPKQIAKLFGAEGLPADRYIGPLYRNEPVDEWTFEYSDSLLTVTYSKSGVMLDAAFSCLDPAGKRREYYPQIKARQASSSSDNRLAGSSGIDIKDAVSLYANTIIYEWHNGGGPVHLLPFDSRTKLNVTALSADFAEVRTEEGYGGWVPFWYLTPAAANIGEIAPRSLRAAESTGISWYPDSVQHAVRLEKGDPLYALREYGEWYGVAVPGSGDSGPYGLLWVQKDQVTADANFPVWYGGAKGTPEGSRAVEAIVRSELLPGVAQARVKELFGLPSFVEQSENVADYDHKARTLPVWRYENGDSELLVGWSADKTIRTVSFQTRSAPAQAADNSIYPLVPTMPVQWDWRFRSDLAYNFLLERIGNVLLVAGEDGGFSGMHMNSNLYALNADTGRKLWQFDFGPEMHHYGMSVDRKQIAFLKRTTKVNEEFYTLQSLQLSTGRKLWEKRINFDPATMWNISFAVSGHSAVVGYQTGRDQEDKHPSYMESWDIRTGKLQWKVTLPDTSDIMLTHSPQPVLLVQSGTKINDGVIAGYSPATGKRLWKLDQRLAANIEEISDGNGYDITNGSKGFWTRSADELIMIDPKTGKDLLRLSIAEGDRYELIDESYAFLRNEAIRNQTESSLVDLRTGRKIFTKKGRADFGFVNAGFLYYRLDYRPMAFDLNTASERKDAFPGVTGPFVTYKGSTLAISRNSGNVYVWDSAGGKADFRLHDVRVGWYDFTPERFIRGYLSADGNRLYMGSANGYFGMISKLPRW